MSENKARVASLVREAREELRRGNRDEAFTLLKKALAMDPGSSAVTEAILEIEKEAASRKEAARSETRRQTRPAEQAAPASRPAEPKQAPARAASAQPARTPVRQAPEPPERRPEQPSSRPAQSQRARETAAPQPARQEVRRTEPEQPPRQARPETRRTEPSPAQQQPRIESRRADPAPPPQTRPAQSRPAAAAPRTAGTSKQVQEDGKLSVTNDLQNLFAQADRALAAGDESGAMSILRKAREAAPDSGEVRTRLLLLQKRIKAENMVRMGLRKLDAGELTEALTAAGEAFALMPQVSGLEELVGRLEKAQAPRQPSARTAAAPAQHGTPARAAAPKRAPHAGKADSADDYVRRVREQIQLSAFPRAALIASEGLEQHPDSDLLLTFVEKFRKMGLLPR